MKAGIETSKGILWDIWVTTNSLMQDKALAVVLILSHKAINN